MKFLFNCTLALLFFSLNADACTVKMDYLTGKFICITLPSGGGSGAVDRVDAGPSGAIIVTPNTGNTVVDIDTAAVPLKTNSQTITGAWDFSTAASTKPVKTGTTLPASCGVGEYFMKSDAAAGSNTYSCTATNTWTLQGGGSSGGTTRGTFASLPTCNSGTSGQAYFFTNSYYEAAQCNGSSWAYLRDGQEFTQPTGLSATSGTTATTSTTNGGTTITLANTNRVEAFTAASNFTGATKTVTACWIPLINLTAQYFDLGIVLRETATGKHVNWTTTQEGQRYKMARAYYTNATAWSSASVFDSGYLQNTVVCARVRKASSNLYFEQSSNGINWITLSTTALTAWFTTDADEAGIGGVANGATVPLYGAFLHFSVN